MRILGASSGALAVWGSVEQRIRQIAALQRGFVSRGQLLEAGIAEATIEWLILQGRLLRVHRGVYAVGHGAPTPLGAETAALLALREGAVLSHHTAAVLWGLRPEGSGDGLIHVTVGASSAGRPDGVHVHRSRALTDRDRRVRSKLPVTAPARTLLDETPLLSTRALERAYDQALIHRLTTPHEIAALLDRCGQHRGRARLKALADTHTTTTFTRSEAEERFLDLVRQAELPQPLTNARRHGYEIDFLWPDDKLAVEIDGYVYHSPPGAFEGDRRKSTMLQRVGISIIRFTWRQLQNEPMFVVANVAQALAAAPR